MASTIAPTLNPITRPIRTESLLPMTAADELEPVEASVFGRSMKLDVDITEDIDDVNNDEDDESGDRMVDVDELELVVAFLPVIPDDDEL